MPVRVVCGVPDGQYGVCYWVKPRHLEVAHKLFPNSFAREAEDAEILAYRHDIDGNE